MFLLRNTAYSLKTKIIGKSMEDILEEITSETDENLNVPTRIYQEIAEKSFNQADYDVIIKFIWRQFTANARPWRRILKTLNLIEYLVKNGCPRFVDDTREEIYHIRLLARFSQLENGEDMGGPIREKTVKLDELLNDDTLLDQERRKADNERRKLRNMGVFGPTSTTSTNANLPGKTYQGFSSEDMNSIVTPNGGVVHKKAESDDGIDVSEDEKDKELNNLDDDGIVKSDKINHIDITKDQKTQITNLIDFDDVPVSSTANTEQTPVNALKDVSNSHQNQQEEKRQSPIWEWDQKPYNKYAKTEEVNDFDWTKAPSTESLDALNVDTYKRSQSTPMQNGASLLDANLTSHTSDSTNKAYNHIIDFGDMKDFNSKSKSHNEIDQLFNNMSIDGGNKAQQSPMNNMQNNFGTNYFVGLNQL